MIWMATLLSLTAAVLASPILSVPHLDDRIVGGEDADIKDYPYQLSFLSGGSHICGASIISPNWALTAAHCSGGSVSSMSLRAGSSIRGSGGTVHQVVEKIIHSQHNNFTKDYDLALLRVETPFEFGEGVAPIALPAQDQVTEANADSITSGWGLTSLGGTDADVLQVVTVPVVSALECQSAYLNFNSHITERMICTGIRSGGLSPCNGDYGGPMVVNGELVGVASWGYKCGAPNYPGVFARVSAMRDWIAINSGV